MTRTETKKKFESPTGIKPMSYQTPGGCSIPRATRTPGEWGHLTEFFHGVCPRCILLGSAMLKSAWINDKWNGGEIFSLVINEIKMKWSTWHKRGTKKNLSPRRNRTHYLPNTGQALYPLSYDNSWRARPFNWVLIWHVACILLGSAFSKLLFDKWMLNHLTGCKEKNFPACPFPPSQVGSSLN